MAITKPRNRVVLFRLTQEEFEEVQQACAGVGSRSVSEYARARILGLTETTSLGTLENKLSDLSRAVTHLTNLVETANAPRAEAASANYVPYLAKSGD